MERIEKDFDKLILKDKSRYINECKSLLKEFKGKNLKVYGKILPSHFKPVLMDKGITKKIKDFSESLQGLLNKITQLCVEKENLRSAVIKDKEVEDLFLVDPGHDKNLFVTRLDNFIINGNFQVIEFNTDSPGEYGRTDMLNELFFKSQIIKKFARKHNIKNIPITEMLLRKILQYYGRFHINKKPVLAIVTWKRPSSYIAEYHIMKNIFENMGVKTIICSFDNLKYKDNALFYKDKKIDIIHKRLTIEETLPVIGKMKDFIKAYKENNVFVINSFRSYLAGDKKILSLLHNGTFSNYMTKREKSIVEKNIPWTCNFESEEVDYKGKKVNLQGILAKNKEGFVIKSYGGFGGKDVFIGRECTAAEWNSAVKKASRDKSYVAQELVELPKMSFPIIHKREIKFEKRNINICPFVIDDKFVSCLSRASSSSTINISSGGAMVPTYFLK
jgi:uncharacterized circularly permuted ATP-grasp superfamily protein